jgi:hypothetical protein
MLKAEKKERAIDCRRCSGATAEREEAIDSKERRLPKMDRLIVIG